MARSVRRRYRLQRAVGNRSPRRNRFGSRSKRHPRRWTIVSAAGLGVVAGILLLMTVAHVHGNPPDSRGSFPEGALETLSEPAGAAVGSLAALILIAWCVRRLRLEFLTWWPGPIVVQNFVAPEEVPAAEVERLTTAFRDRLGVSHLQSCATVPAAAEQGDFLDVLGRQGAEPGGMLSTLVAFLRAGLPAHGYEVRGALVKRETPPPYGVTVQVVRLPGKGTGGHTVWDGSWDRAVRHAADHATAAMLPCTRACRSPWSAWRRYYMPPSLLRAYEEAAECEEQRRYDEALGYYFEALKLDPMNYGLRLQIGYLQEKQALYLDALETYEGILTIAHPSNNSEARGSRPQDVRKAYRGRARRERARTELVTRYRRAVLLGGDGLCHQWRKTARNAPTKRDEERERLRERLAFSLTELFECADSSPDVDAMVDPLYAEAAGATRPGPQAWRAALAQSPAATASLPHGELEQLLLLASLYALQDVLERTAEWRFWQPAVSAEAVRVSQLIVEERLRLQLAALSGARLSPLDSYVQHVGEELEKIEGRTGFDRWHEHYNAACIYALRLPTKGNREHSKDVERLAEAAVERLRRASARADSAFMASRRDWVLSEDPDLRGLRAQRQFKVFEAAYFPSASRPPQRPDNAHRWEASRYTLDLLRAAARRWEDTWQARAVGTGGDGDNGEALLRWCEDDREARRLVEEVAQDYKDWHTRNALVERMRGWSVDYGFAPLEVPYPPFVAEGRWTDGVVEIESATKAAIGINKRRLTALITALNPDTGSVTGETAQSAPAPSQLFALHAELWRRTRELLSSGDGNQAAVRELGRIVQAVQGGTEQLTVVERVAGR
jgi:hypothetical protein